MPTPSASLRQGYGWQASLEEAVRRSFSAGGLHKLIILAEATAEGKLGIFYQEGKGVPRDYVQAHMWYNLAAAAGHKDAGVLRDYLAEQMTPPQRREVQRLAREWKPKPRQKVCHH